jgi:Right handed beta helix region
VLAFTYNPNLGEATAMEHPPRQGQGLNIQTAFAVILLLACAGLVRSTYASEVDEGRQHDHGKLTVCKHGCRFQKVQHAVNAARSGDTIEIGPGTYLENVVIDGKNLILVGASAHETTMDGGFHGSVFTLSQATVTLTGMTITHGRGETGGGISVISSDLDLTDAIIVSNAAAQHGGGINVNNFRDHSTSLKSQRCVITHNSAPAGGGIYLTVESDLTLVDSTVARNEADAGGGLFLEYATVSTLTRTTISDNASGGDGGGIWAAPGNPREGEPHPRVSLDHSAVVNNTAAQDGGGIFNFNTHFFSLQGGTIIALNTPGP